MDRHCGTTHGNQHRYVVVGEGRGKLCFPLSAACEAHAPPLPGDHGSPEQAGTRSVWLPMLLVASQAPKVGAGLADLSFSTFCFVFTYFSLYFHWMLCGLLLRFVFNAYFLAIIGPFSVACSFKVTLCPSFRKANQNKSTKQTQTSGVAATALALSPASRRPRRRRRGRRLGLTTATLWLLWPRGLRQATPKASPSKGACISHADHAQKVRESSSDGLIVCFSLFLAHWRR